MIRPFRIALILAACQMGLTHASFKAGYGDNLCTVSISEIRKFAVFNASAPFGSGSTDGVAIRYGVACTGGNYSVLTIQSKGGSGGELHPSYFGLAGWVQVSKVNTCLPAKFGITNVRYDESAKKVVVTNEFNTSISCPDATLNDMIGSFSSNLQSTKAGAPITWTSPTTAFEANKNGLVYDSEKFTVSLPFAGKILPGKQLKKNPAGTAWMDGDPDIANYRWFAKVSYKADPKYFAIVHLLPGFTDDNYYNKPLIVGDAFDPPNGRGLVQDPHTSSYMNIGLTERYANLINEKGPRGLGYDLYFLDFSQGAGDLFINAGIELKFVEWLETQTGAKFMLGGPSMSGLISRIALLYSMPQNNAAKKDYGTRIKGYLPIDSPLQGASISTSLQYQVARLRDNNLIEAVEFLGISMEARDNWNQIIAPASHQMLYEHYYADGSSQTATHDAFYAQLKAMGNYRYDIPNAAIAYSNFYQNTVPSPETQVPFGTLTIPGGGGTFSFWARGHDFDAGSNGGIVWNSFKGGNVQGFSSANWGTPAEKMKATFIPIQSALDLGSAYTAGQVPADNYQLAKNSPFNFLYYMKNPYNGYCTTAGACAKLDANPPRATIDDKKYQHLIFDVALMKTINTGLQNLEGFNKSVNNDRYDDLLFLDSFGNSAFTDLSTGSGFRFGNNWTPTPMPEANLSHTFTGDFNGDGYVDLGYRDNTNAIQIRLSNGYSFIPKVAWIPSGGYGNANGKLYVGDYDGNGRDDLLYFDDGEKAVYVALSSGTAFNAPNSGKWIQNNGYGSLKNNYKVGDFNGDGKSDLGYYEGDQTFYVAISTGSAFTGSGSGKWLAYGYFGNNVITPYVGDFSGDGRDDLVVFNQTNFTLTILRSIGTGFAPASASWANYKTFGTVASAYFPGDYNGDGVCDLGYFEFYDGGTFPKNSFQVKTDGMNLNGMGKTAQWIAPDFFGSVNGLFLTTYHKKRVVIP
jgi:hypothetical protein